MSFVPKLFVAGGYDVRHPEDRDRLNHDFFAVDTTDVKGDSAVRRARVLDLRCPVCKKLVVHNTLKAWHFKHIDASSCPLSQPPGRGAYGPPESAHHDMVKSVLMRELRAAGYTNIEDEVTLRKTDGSRRRLDVVAENGEKKAGFEVQRSTLTANRFTERVADISAMGLYQMWVFVASSYPGYSKSKKEELSASEAYRMYLYERLGGRGATALTYLALRVWASHFGEVGDVVTVPFALVSQELLGKDEFEVRFDGWKLAEVHIGANLHEPWEMEPGPLLQKLPLEKVEFWEHDEFLEARDNALCYQPKTKYMDFTGRGV